MPVFRGIRTQNAYYDSVCVESLRLENGYERCVAPESLPLVSGNVPDGAEELQVNACEVAELPRWLVCRDDVTCIIILSICPLPPTLGCFHGHPCPRPLFSPFKPARNVFSFLTFCLAQQPISSGPGLMLVHHRENK